jgi:hypothetical protein
MTTFSPDIVDSPIKEKVKSQRAKVRKNGLLDGERAQSPFTFCLLPFYFPRIMLKPAAKRYGFT